MAFDLKQMERDILEKTSTQDRMWSIYDTGLPIPKFLLNKYGPNEGREQLIVVIQYLLEERYLIPPIDNTKRDSRVIVRGLTPKGYRRLRELQAPRWTWFKGNWFPVIVAGITAMIGIGSIVVDATCNRG